MSMVNIPVAWEKVHGVAQAFTHPIHLATDRGRMGDGWGRMGPAEKGHLVIGKWQNGSKWLVSFMDPIKGLG